MMLQMPRSWILTYLRTHTQSDISYVLRRWQLYTYTGKDECSKSRSYYRDKNEAKDIYVNNAKSSPSAKAERSG